MNKVRRKEIINIMEQLYEAETKIADAYVTIIEKNAEEEEYRDNMPENMWGGEKYEISEEASDSMEYAYESLEELSDRIMVAISYLEDAIA